MLRSGDRVLIIGGTRYIGRHTCLAALTAGAKVTVFHRGRSGNDWIGAHPEVERILGDQTVPDDLARAFRSDYDAVYDMIAYRPEEIRPLLGPHADRIGHLVVCSTTSVYAPALYQPIDEAHPRGPHPAWGAYNEGKNAVEDLLAAGGVRSTVLRPQWVFGPHDYQHLAAFYLTRLHAGRPVWLSHAGVAQLNWTYAPDLAAAFVAVSGVPAAAGQAFNVCAEETLTTLEFIRLCAAVLGVTPDIRHYRPEDLPGELRGQRSGPVRDLPLACTSRRLRSLPGLDPAFRPTSMPAALVHTVEWLRTSGGLEASPGTPLEDHLNAGG